MATVADLICEKGSTVHCVERRATVYEAIEKMVRHNVGALLVMENGDLLGIITERDYLRYVALQGRTSRSTAVDEIMSVDPSCVSPETSLAECMSIMTEKRVRHLPVLEEDCLA